MPGARYKYASFPRTVPEETTRPSAVAIIYASRVKSGDADGSWRRGNGSFGCGSQGDTAGTSFTATDVIAKEIIVFRDAGVDYELRTQGWSISSFGSSSDTSLISSPAR